MASIYTPSAVKLTTFQVADDGEDVTAASVNVPDEAIADGVAYLNLAIANRMDEFLAAGTWTCPPDVFVVDLEGCGAGGPGGTGGNGAAVTNRWSAGGAGGAGAPLSRRRVAVVPGQTYTVTPGSGVDGNGDGAPSTFGALATLPGGGKGRSSPAAVQASTATTPLVLPGGLAANAPTPMSGKATGDFFEASSIENSYTFGFYPVHGAGGAGLSSNSTQAPSRPGMSSTTGFAGGVAGTHGTTSASYGGGGGGGGGGAGPYGAGGAGANGANGNSAGAGTAGSTPAAPAVNTGAGGGGGSGGSSGTSGTPAGAAGALGGSGRVRISYVGRQAVIT